jgi:major membrane immunogen (membrane-anchored lipoprotein)
MTIKRPMVFVCAFVLALVFAAMPAAAGGQQEGGQTQVASTDMARLQDGIYFAQEDGFNERTGWKYMATLEVADGTIVSAEWNGANRDGGTDKITRSRSGEYGMVENGGAMAPWWEQAQAAEEYLLETQDPTQIIYTDEEGHTDAIAGATIHVVEFFDLVKKALAQGPVGLGSYTDGQYHAEEAAFDHGYKYFVDLTVVSGYIVAANWDAYAEGGGKNKKQASIDGEYGMVANGGAIAPWFEQARAVENHLLETQDPTEIALDGEGGTDAISGATITVQTFFELAEEALSEAM